MVEAQLDTVRKIQTYSMLASALLSILLAGLTLFNLTMPRPVVLAMAVVLLVNAAMLFWTIGRLKR